MHIYRKQLNMIQWRCISQVTSLCEQNGKSWRVGELKRARRVTSRDNVLSLDGSFRNMAGDLKVRPSGIPVQLMLIPSFRGFPFHPFLSSGPRLRTPGEGIDIMRGSSGHSL
jgi:hypothetical protein